MYFISNRFYVSLFVVIIKLFCFVSPSTAQTITVLSKEDRQAIVQAHVICQCLSQKNNQHVFMTSSAGTVQLDSTEAKQYPIRITLSSIGYTTLIDTLSSNQNRTYFLSPENTSLNEVVITGQYSPNNPENAIHKVRIIDRKRIELQGAQNLRDVLNNELNVRISQDNILGSSMSLQGMSGQNVKILIDGVPVIGRLDGNIDLSQINLNNVERIEIIEGPLSVNYGTNALAGTINIITKKTQSSAFSSSITTYYESIGQYNLAARIGLSRKKTTVSVFGGRNYFDGWRMSDARFYKEENALADSNRYMDWKPKEQYFGTAMFQQQWRTLNIGLTSDLFYEKITNKGKPRAPYYETAFDDYYRTYRFNNSINITGKLSPNYNITAIAAYNYFQRIKNTYYNDLTTLKQTLTDNAEDQDTSTFKTGMSRASISNTKDSSQLHYEIGYDLNQEIAEGKRIKNEKQYLGDYALFGSLEYSPFETLTIRPGLRFAYNTVYIAPVIPSLNIKLNIKKITLRASYAKGFRAPSLKELYFYFVDINHNIQGFEALKAERSDNYSISVNAQQLVNQKTYKADLTFFYNDIHDMITLAQTSGANYTYTNIGTYKTKGINLNTEMAINHFKLAIGGSYMGRYNELSTQKDIEKYNYSPEFRSNVLYEFKKSALNIAFFYKYTGILYGYGINAQEQLYQTRTQDFHTADVSITKSLWKKRVRVCLGSKNLFDVKTISSNSSSGAHSQSSSSIPVSMGRTYFLKVEFTFNSN